MDSTSAEGPTGGGGSSTVADSSSAEGSPSTVTVEFDLNQTYSSLESLKSSYMRLGSENAFIPTMRAKSYFTQESWPFQETTPFDVAKKKKG